MAEIVEMEDGGANVDWDAVHALFGNDTEDDIGGGEPLMDVYDEFGCDSVELCADGNVTYTDRNSGVHSFTTTPPPDLDAFLAELRDLLEA